MSASTDQTVCVVGASLAGLRACEGLRKAGYNGRLIVLGAEPHLPYNRPPLSKDALTGASWEPELLRIPPALASVQWELGDPVSHADLEARTLTTQAGRTISLTGLVVASGLRPRRLLLPGPTEGRFALRTLEDLGAIRDALGVARSVAIVGSGFIGCELALSVAALGHEVHVVAPEAEPLERVLGPMLGAALRARLQAAGVQFASGTVPVACRGDARVEGIDLSDGSQLDCDVLVEAVGSQTNVEWLDGNGLNLDDGVECDSWLAVHGRPDVVACGDVARFPHVLSGERSRRVEHWTMASDSGKYAGKALAETLGGGAPERPFDPMPSFWSDLGDLRLQGFGLPALGLNDVRVLEGDPAADCAVGYFDRDQLVGAVCLGMGSRYGQLRSRVQETMTSRRPVGV